MQMNCETLKKYETFPSWLFALSKLFIHFFNFSFYQRLVLKIQPIQPRALCNLSFGQLVARLWAPPGAAGAFCSILLWFAICKLTVKSPTVYVDRFVLPAGIATQRTISRILKYALPLQRVYAFGDFVHDILTNFPDWCYHVKMKLEVWPRCLKITAFSAKRVMVTFWEDKSSLKMPKMVN